jgi:hypothetical protein
MHAELIKYNYLFQNLPPNSSTTLVLLLHYVTFMYNLLPNSVGVEDEQILYVKRLR